MNSKFVESAKDGEEGGFILTITVRGAD